MVEQYEAEAHPIPPASDAELLQHLLEAQAVTPSHVAQAMGLSAATLAAVLAATHPLTCEEIGTLRATSRCHQASLGLASDAG